MIAFKNTITDLFRGIYTEILTGSLRTVNENFNFDPDKPWESKYFSMGFHAVRLEPNTFVPIISMAMPDIRSGRVEQTRFDISNANFFILNDGIVSGPFNAQTEDETCLVMPAITPATIVNILSLNENHVAQFNYSDLESAGLILKCSVDGFEKLFFTSLKRAKDEVTFKTKDYISDSALIRQFAKMDYGKSAGNLSKAEAQKLTSSIDEYSRKNKITSHNERNIRIKEVLSQYLNFKGIGVDIVQDFLVTKEGKKFLTDYVDLNKEILLKDKISSIERDYLKQQEKFQREISEIQTKLETKRSELEQFELVMEQKKEKIHKEIDDLNAQSEEKKQNDLRDKNSKLMQEIEANEKLLRDLKLTVGSYSDLHSMQKEKEKLDSVNDHLRNEKHKIQGLIDSQLATIQNPHFSDKLVEFKTIQMLLNGISPENSSSPMTPVLLQKYGVEVTGETRNSYIKSLMHVLDSTSGRHYSYDETANLLLCTLQSYVTVLAGPPGTGKTSTVNRLADALGLVSKHKKMSETDSFLSVAVGRGWMSSREMLGFFNSFKNTFQPSRSGLYQFLEAFSNCHNDAENPEYLKMVLMDEANLSSIEHYWSDFLLMCDSFENNHKIDLGISGKGERYLKIPRSLRFLCTINNDATVETLSNRFIDRAAIISLGYGEKSSTAELQSGLFSGAVPYAELMKAFNPQSNEEELEERESARLKFVLDHLSTGSQKGTQINFSPRKLNAITKYCYIANQLNYEKNEPMDYAISQHVLPSLTGHGQGFRERLQRLEEKLDEFKYSVSRKIVSNIIETGDDFSDSYSFF
ncbi:hypothetical protein [Undibacterium sp. WLHG33]|uniref:hypothetical protein n=1 Tax=Undibacterium sp. WLHG33 TaxID=3412482 RepID=UPI003C3031B0